MSAGNAHSGSLLPAPILLPPLSAEQGGQCRDCRKRPWRWQHDLLEPELPQREVFVEPEPQAVLSRENKCPWSSSLPQLDCFQYLSSRDNPGSFPYHPWQVSRYTFRCFCWFGLPHSLVEIAVFTFQEPKSHQLLCFNGESKHESSWRWTALG